MKSKLLVKTLKLDLPSKCVEFSPDGGILVVGFGNGIKTKGKFHPKEGSFTVLSFDSWKVQYERKDANAALNRMKFSPNGKLLAVASEDCSIYLYNIEDNFLLKNIIRTHEAPLKEIDFARDGSILVSIDISLKVCYTSLPLGLPVDSFDEVNFDNFVDCSNYVSWSVRGAWLAQQQPQRITSLSKARDSPLMVCGNDKGKIFLFQYPSFQHSGFLTTEAHTGDVVDVRWSVDSNYFFTVGSDDCTIMQWKVVVLPTVEPPLPISLDPLISEEDGKEDGSVVWRGMLIPELVPSGIRKIQLPEGNCTIQV